MLRKLQTPQKGAMAETLNFITFGVKPTHEETDLDHRGGRLPWLSPLR